MPILKCKKCGGDFNIEENVTICYCEHCGTKQTVPKKKKIVFGVIAAVMSVVAIIIAVIVGKSIISKSIINEQKIKELVEKVDSIKVGDTIDFGSYEWRVLDKNGKQLLILAKDIVAKKPYNDTYEDITWEKCTLRKWLNNDFYKTSFNSAEKSRIVTTNVSADENPEYSTSPGNATQDKVFLLSIGEANKYFRSDGDRRCQHIYIGGDCWWWLRSPGMSSECAAYVGPYGKVDCGGENVPNDNLIVVHPALWINLES